MICCVLGIVAMMRPDSTIKITLSGVGHDPIDLGRDATRQSEHAFINHAGAVAIFPTGT